MIKLEKGSKPDILIENEKQWNIDYVKYVLEKIGDSSCEKRHRHPQIKQAVVRESHGKCIYCEEKNNV